MILSIKKANTDTVDFGEALEAPGTTTYWRIIPAEIPGRQVTKIQD